MVEGRKVGRRRKGGKEGKKEANSESELEFRQKKKKTLTHFSPVSASLEVSFFRSFLALSCRVHDSRERTERGSRGFAEWDKGGGSRAIGKTAAENGGA